MTTTHDPWLRQRSASDWIAEARSSLARAKHAMEDRDQRSLIALLKHGAGVALNAVLLVQSHPTWGRLPTQHLAGLAITEGAPPDVRKAAQLLHDARVTDSSLVQLGRSPSSPQALFDFASLIVGYSERIALSNGSSTRSSIPPNPP